jgi:hypothetical protein
VVIPSKSLEEFASDCTTRTIETFILESRLAKNAEKMYIELMDLAIRSPKMSSKQLVILALSIKIFRLLQCIKDEFMSGYYEVAQSSLRSVFEHSQLVTFFAKHEDKAHKYLHGTKYDPQQVRDKIADGPENIEAIKAAYKAFSDYASHAYSVKSLATIIEKVQGKTVEFIIYPSFNKDEAQLCFSYFLHWYWFSIVKMHEAFSDRLKDNKLWLEKFAKWDDVFVKYIKEDIERRREYLQK